MNISFVILHYDNNKSTFECVTSLLKYLSNKKYKVEIVIVDNGSPSQKFACVYNKTFSNNKHIHLITLNTNLGFSKGNNVGYKYSKYTLQSNVIILANNDIVFSQEKFLDHLEKNVVEKHVDIAGPKIFSNESNIDENPIPRQFYSENDILKRIVKDCVLLSFSYCFSLDIFLSQKFGQTIKKDGSNFLEKSKKDFSNFQLHGSCLIFANNYLKEKDGLYDKPFMYGEENILRYVVDVHHYKMLYIPELYVRHNDGLSTPGTYKTNVKKRQFRYKNAIKSNFLLIKLIRNNNH
ncbi:glycosyltransferase family 2 protein [Limosilactobacillus fermentum]